MKAPLLFMEPEKNQACLWKLAVPGFMITMSVPVSLRLPTISSFSAAGRPDADIAAVHNEGLLVFTLEGVCPGR